MAERDPPPLIAKPHKISVVAQNLMFDWLCPRVLIQRRSQNGQKKTFGLLIGVEHAVFGTDAEVVLWLIEISRSARSGKHQRSAREPAGSHGFLQVKLHHRFSFWSEPATLCNTSAQSPIFASGGTDASWDTTDCPFAPASTSSPESMEGEARRACPLRRRDGRRRCRSSGSDRDVRSGPRSPRNRSGRRSSRSVAGPAGGSAAWAAAIPFCRL